MIGINIKANNINNRIAPINKTTGINIIVNKIVIIDSNILYYLSYKY